MKIFERAAKFFGLISVRETANQIRITGIDGLVMRTYFKHVFESDAISKTMFTEITDTAITLNSFFLPDFIYMLNKLKVSPQCGWSGRRTIAKILHEFDENTWWKKTKQDVAPIVDKRKLKHLKWTPLPHQLEFLDQFGDRMPRYDLRGIVLGAAPGTGKEQRLDSLVRTPNGWVKMRDIKVGSRIVTPDGGTAPVSAIYPQGKKDIYRIHFEDGRWTDSGEEHLWKVYHKDWKRYGNTPDGYKILTTRDIIDYIRSHPTERRLYVPLIKPEQKPDVNLPIDPYVLGAFLGDGSIGRQEISFTTVDEFILNEITGLIPSYLEFKKPNRITYRLGPKSDSSWFHKRTPFLDDIRSLGLNGCVSHTKFIPKQYLNASENQKLALIQGLMDTDGTADKKTGTPSFCTTSLTLAKQVQEMIRSLGGLCKISEKQSYYTHKGERRKGRLAYILSIRYHDGKKLFRLHRKQKLVPENYHYKNSLRLRIRDVSYVGKHEAQCIAVDHPDHLYITDDYIVTHNTFLDFMVATCIIPPSVAEVKIIISPKKAIHLVWEKTINQVFHKLPTYWVCDSGIKMPLDKTEYYIFNFEQLDNAILLGRSLASKGVRYFVIIDESHNFADYRSARTQKLVKLLNVRDNIYSIWASGSPILKLGSELISFLKCSDPRFDADAERRFRRIYTTSPGRANEIFNHRLGLMMGVIIPKSVVSQTKPTVKELPVKLPPSLAHRFLMSTVREDMKAFIIKRLEEHESQIKTYRKVVGDGLDYHEKLLTTRSDRKKFDEYRKNLKMIMQAPDLMLADIAAAARNYERTVLFPSLQPRKRAEFRSSLSAVKNIKLKVRGEALGTVLSKRRSECAAALGVFCNPDVIMRESLSKTLFFASSVLPVKVLEKHLLEKGFEPAVVYAETNSQLNTIMDRFDKDPNLNPICATFQSLSEAVPVVAASTVVFLNRPFRESVSSQVTARADRLGQIHPVTVIEVTLDTGAEPNVSSTTDAILANVRQLVNELVGPAFAGPDPDEREYQDAIDASNQNPDVFGFDQTVDL